MKKTLAIVIAVATLVFADWYTAPGQLSLAPAASAAQDLRCVTSYQSNGTIYIRNGCSATIWWHACVTWTGTGITNGFNHTGIAEGGDWDFSPGAGAPFTFYLLTTDSLAGWQPQC